jgi:hypothetical protein
VSATATTHTHPRSCRGQLERPRPTEALVQLFVRLAGR